eukprot:CAMPEP_0182893216 /NCGR_PEP_ID=MMETSP0034_2-20130328/24345_1 /TAXON_ID=156128 /ORGANISM="Nephroselmis pyriformis, Strain CCMP717" /LENGTH=81 /DNA_ID=CAMNT_0025026947 /DNA_START=47 /DNA_END=288 /DNA_ORIENTATION=-
MSGRGDEVPRGPSGTPYEMAVSHLSRAAGPLPTLVAVAADGGLWAAPALGAPAAAHPTLHPEAQSVVSALHAKEVRLAAVG